jgi:hypothetical protein
MIENKQQRPMLIASFSGISRATNAKAPAPYRNIPLRVFLATTRTRTVAQACPPKEGNLACRRLASQAALRAGQSGAFIF